MRSLTGILLFFLPLFLSAQQESEPVVQSSGPGIGEITNDKHRDIFLRLNDTFDGGFGSDSQCSHIRIVVSGLKKGGDLDRPALRCHSLHRGIQNHFDLKPSIENIFIATAEDYLDTVNSTQSARFTIDSLIANGWKMFFAEGSYELTEDAGKKYAGSAKGIFRITFLFHSAEKKVASLPDAIRLQEPAIIFTGIWNPYLRKDVNTPYFFSSIKPFITEKKELLLPDFRFQSDGQVRPDKWITLQTPKGKNKK